MRRTTHAGGAAAMAWSCAFLQVSVSWCDVSSVGAPHRPHAAMPALVRAQPGPCGRGRRGSAMGLAVQRRGNPPTAPYKLRQLFWVTGQNRTSFTTMDMQAVS